MLAKKFLAIVVLLTTLFFISVFIDHISRPNYPPLGGYPLYFLVKTLHDSAPPGWVIISNGKKFSWRRPSGLPSLYSYEKKQEAIEWAWDQYEYEKEREENTNKDNWKVVK